MSRWFCLWWAKKRNATNKLWLENMRTSRKMSWKIFATATTMFCNRQRPSSRFLTYWFFALLPSSRHSCRSVVGMTIDFYFIWTNRFHASEHCYAQSSHLHGEDARKRLNLEKKKLNLVKIHGEKCEKKKVDGGDSGLWTNGFYWSAKNFTRTLVLTHLRLYTRAQCMIQKAMTTTSTATATRRTYEALCMCACVCVRVWEVNEKDECRHEKYCMGNQFVA